MTLTPEQLDKAAEAARQAYYPAWFSRERMPAWEQMDRTTQDLWRAVAKAAIEAVEQAEQEEPQPEGEGAHHG